MHLPSQFLARSRDLASQAHTTLLVARIRHAATLDYTTEDRTWFRRPVRG